MPEDLQTDELTYYIFGHFRELLDVSKSYRAYARPYSRSLMNLTFRTPSEQLNDKFIKDAQAAGMDGMKGHRATGCVGV